MLSIFNYNITPKADKILAPCHLLIGRRFKIPLPVFKKSSTSGHSRSINLESNETEKNYDRGTKKLSELKSSQKVYLQIQNLEWLPGYVNGPKDYVIKTENGKEINP